MKSLKVNNCNLRDIHLKNEFRKFIFKSLYADHRIRFEIRNNAFRKMRLLPRVYKSEIENRCLVSNRGRSVKVKYKLARSVLRNSILVGKVYGVKKSSW